MKLKLEQNILALLSIQSMTGYDIKKQIDTEGRFERRKAPLSQIYNTLKRMVEAEWVIFEEEHRDGKPDIKIYSPTPAGTQHLIDYLCSPLEKAFRYTDSSILFRVRYAFLVDPAVTIKNIEEELAFRQEQIGQFRHRDRTIQSDSLNTADLAYAQALNDQIHFFGAANMDQYVEFLQRLTPFFEKKDL